MTSGKARAIRGAGAALLALLCLAGPVVDHARAAGALLRLVDPTAEGSLASFGRGDVREEPMSIPREGGDVRGRLYLPVGDPHPAGIVLVHGVHRLGLDEPRLRRFAASLAGSGVAVLTPQIDELAAFAIDPRSIDTIGAAATELRARLGLASGAGTVGLVGISFGGGLAIVTAADPRYAPHVGLVASVGGHHDLAEVLRFFAADPRAHDYGPLILVYGHLDAFFAAADVEIARAALRAWLWERFDEARARAAALTPPGRATMDLLFAHRVRELGPRLAEVARGDASRTSAVSPAAHLARLRAPLFVLHGEGDPVIPASEAGRLARDCPAGLLRSVLVSPAITHAEVDRRVTVLDRLALVRFLRELLEASERARLGLP